MATGLPEYRLSPKAREDLEAIWLYSLTHWGLSRARHYMDSVTKKFELLAYSSALGEDASHIRPGYRRFPVEQHVIYFRKAQDGIEIVRLLHGRMQASLHF